MKNDSYLTPSSVDQAIKDAAKAKYKTNNSSTVSNLIGQEYMNRFLSRVFRFGDENWVLKGGTGILARIANARATVDIDLLNKSEGLDDALQILISLAKKELSDFFRFEYLEHGPISEGETQKHLSGYRVTFQIYIGQATRGVLKVDLVSGSIITGTIVKADSAIRLDLPRLQQESYRLYPITDQLADKICAMIETHNGEFSSRVKDLIDFVEIITHFNISGDEVFRAISAESIARELDLPKSFIPTNSWIRGYETLAKKTQAVSRFIDFSDAVSLMRSFLDPLLQDKDICNMTWYYDSLRWGKNG